MTVKRHLVILLVLTVLIRGMMFISYPMGGQDEAQGNQSFAVNRILQGELQFGFLRYPPGYALTVAPFALLGEQFGRFDERVVLLAQIALSSFIPFLLYDIFRTRHSPQAAFLISLISLVDPFGLQWAHFSLPVWIVALCLVLALWLLHYAEIRKDLRLFIAAGLVAGWGVLGRWNFAPLVAGIGCFLLLTTTSSFRQRLMQVFNFGFSSLLIIFLVHITIQVPSTGVWNLNCLSGFTLIEALLHANIEIQARNGPNAERLLELTTLPPLPENLSKKGYYGGYRMFFADNFPNWIIPGPWAKIEDSKAYLAQSNPEIPETNDPTIILNTMSWMFYYLGPCKANELLQRVYFETVFASPLRVLSQIPRNVYEMLHPPLKMSPDETDYYYYSLPSTDSIEFKHTDGFLGFVRAVRQQQLFYNGQWVWRPGIEIISTIWAPLNLLRILVIPALVWSFFTRRRIYSVIAFLLLLYLVSMSVIVWPQQRIYAIVYPLGPILIGGFLLAVWDNSRKWIARW